MKIGKFKNNIKFILISFVFLQAVQLFADSKIVYENAEDGSIIKWDIYTSNLKDKYISNIYDDSKDSRVIRLDGHHGYILGSTKKAKSWNNTQNDSITWSMNFSDSFNIYIFIETKKGYRYLHYTNKNYSKGKSKEVYIHHGLGESANDGTWHTITRNVREDLKDFEPENELISTYAFLVNGKDGLLDDISMSGVLGTEVENSNEDIAEEADTSSNSDNDTDLTQNSSGSTECDANNPKVQYIKTLADWDTINRPDKSIFCVKPNIYFSSKSQDNILITASGTASKKRYIILDNGNDLHPGKLSHDKLAKVRFTFDSAKHWVVDRMAYWGLSKEPILEFKKSDDITINRYLLEDTNYGVMLYHGTENTTIQNSRFERSKPFAYDLSAIGLSNGGHSNISIKNTKILNNEIYNYNDPFQSIKTGSANQTNVNYEGTLVEGNHFYVDSKIYTDCHGNSTPSGRCSYSENAIDLKSGSENANNKMIIRNNKMWGFKKADKTNSGMSDQGIAIVIHYNVNNLVVENNLIFDSENSIVSGDGRNGYAMRNATISNNIFYNIKGRAFYIGEAKNIDMSNNLFKNTSINGTYWGILDKVKSIKFENNIISSASTNYKSFYSSSSSDIYSQNLVYGEEIPSYSGFTQLTSEPTSKYKDLTFVTDRYTNHPRTIRIPKVLKP